MERIKLGIDLDGTLADTEAKLLRVLERRYGIKVTPEDIWGPESGRTFSGTAGIARHFNLTYEQVKDAFVEAWRDYRDIQLVDESIPRIMRKAQRDYEVCIVTASYGSRENIEAWLRLNEIPYDRFIQVKSPAEKMKAGMDVQVDDSGSVAKLFGDNNAACVLLSQRWNMADQPSLKEQPTVRIVNGWDEVSGMLESGSVKKLIRKGAHGSSVELLVRQ